MSRDGVRGGYVCPIPWCDHREYTPSMIQQHVREEHPEETL